MTVTASLIQTLHRINRQKADLQGQLGRGPKVVAMAQAKLQAAKKNSQDIRDKMTRMRIEADAKQLQMKEREGKIHNWQGQMNAAKENRAYQTLKDQIAADTQANLVLSDEILEILEGLDEMSQVLKNADAQVAIVEDEFQKIDKQVGERKRTLESELARVIEELAEAEKGLSGDFQREYTRLVAARGDDAMAALEGNCCSGCYQSLTPQILEQLSVGKPIVCPSCGRLIYRQGA